MLISKMQSVLAVASGVIINLFTTNPNTNLEKIYTSPYRSFNFQQLFFNDIFLRLGDSIRSRHDRMAAMALDIQMFIRLNLSNF